MVSVRESVGGLPPLLRLNLPRSLHDVRSGLARFRGALLSRMLACGALPAAVGPVILIPPLSQKKFTPHWHL